MRDQDEACEALLARLFTDADFRERFVRRPRAVAAEWGLDEASVAALARSDFVGLELAARSYAGKRAGRGSRPARASCENDH